MPSQAHADLPVAETLRDLLARLLLWQQERDRRAFLEFALAGHPALADFQHGGQPLTVATELVTRLRQGAFQALPDGTHPVCALLREVRTRREDGNPDTAGRIAVLARFFGCDPPLRVARAGSPWLPLPRSHGLRLGPEPRARSTLLRPRARNLVNSIAGHWQDGRLRVTEEAERLRTDPGAFPGFLHRLLKGRPAWLLILDQFEVFSRDADRPRDAVRLLVCGEQGGQATVEVAHEALLREWPRLAVWIRTRREALIRRDEVRRDAARWDERGRPDHLLPHPELLAEVRARLAAAGLWEDLRREERIAWFLAQDDPADLGGLTLDAFRRHGCDGTKAALPLLAVLTRPGRTWETSEALGRWALEQGPELVGWLRAGLTEVLTLLGTEDALSWHRRRLGIGDLLAALGDDRPGVGLRPDGLPAIDWVPAAPGAPPWQAPGGVSAPRRGPGLLARIGRTLRGAGRGTIGRVERIARYPVTNAQYLAFTQAPDFGSPDWLREGYHAPESQASPWPQPNRPRVSVAWVEAMAYCRWLTARYRAAGLIGAGDKIRLPTEAEWEGALRAGTDREYPWGDGYRVGHANVDETSRKDGPHNLGQTTAVGLYPQGASPSGLLDCAGNVWEWCLNKYEAPDDTNTSGKAGRSLRGGSWGDSPAVARAVFRGWFNPVNRSFSVGFRLVCACPIPLITESLITDLLLTDDRRPRRRS